MTISKTIISEFRRLSGLDEVVYPIGTRRKWKKGEVVKTATGWELVSGPESAVAPHYAPPTDTTVATDPPDTQQSELLYGNLGDALDQHKDKLPGYGAPKDFQIVKRSVYPNGETAVAHFQHSDSKNFVMLDMKNKKLIVPQGADTKPEKQESIQDLLNNIASVKKPSYDTYLDRVKSLAGVLDKRTA